MKKKYKKNLGIIVLCGLFILVELNNNQNNSPEERMQKKVPIEGDYFAMLLDGEEVDELPNAGTYLVDYVCDNNSKVEWNRETGELFISKNTSVTENCILTFKTNPLVSELEQGSYIAYEGNNGCLKNGTSVTGTGDAENGNSCLGYNANANIDGSNDAGNGTYGYCSDIKYKYYTSGWRIAYTEEGRAYIVSAASPECILRPYLEPEGFTTTASSLSLGSASYYYGTSYTFSAKSGTYTLSGTLTNGVWSDIYNSVIGQYTCRSTSATGSCSSIYQIEGYNSSTYAYAYSKQSSGMMDDAVYVAEINSRAKKYCNFNFVDDCTSDTDVHAINNTDFNKMTAGITGTTGGYLYTTIPGATKCGGVFYKSVCGLNNDLIDNGGYYRFASINSAITESIVHWSPLYRSVSYGTGTSAFGLRPVIRLSSDVYVTGGSGTPEDPYTIAK